MVLLVHRKITKTLLILVAFFLFFNATFALKDVSRAYCEALNYTFKIFLTDEGEKGVCILPNGNIVDAWKFYQGEVGKEYSYCSLINASVKISKEREVCKIEECVVCEFQNGTQIPILKLMNISLKEEICGDKICATGENYENCPVDCPSGSLDGYCDGIKDGKCDLDCIFQNISKKDSDCPFCGNGICEKDENTLNCPEDCSLCGNKICERGENQSNCCLDCGCPFGYRCIKNECVKTGNFLIYFIVISIIAALLAIIIFKTKKTYEKPS